MLSNMQAVSLRVLPVSLSRHCASPSRPCQVEEALSAAMDVGVALCVTLELEGSPVLPQTGAEQHPQTVIHPKN